MLINHGTEVPLYTKNIYPAPVKYGPRWIINSRCCQSIPTNTVSILNWDSNTTTTEANDKLSNLTSKYTEEICHRI